VARPSGPRPQELDIVLVRISDGAMHHLAHRHHHWLDNWNDTIAFNPDEDDVQPEVRFLVKFCENLALSDDTCNITPWFTDDVINGTYLNFDCEMTAVGYDGARWNHFCLRMWATADQGNTDVYFDNAHYMAHALAMLPWTLN